MTGFLASGSLLGFVRRPERRPLLVVLFALVLLAVGVTFLIAPGPGNRGGRMVEVDLLTGVPSLLVLGAYPAPRASTRVLPSRVTTWNPAMLVFAATSALALVKVSLHEAHLRTSRGRRSAVTPAARAVHRPRGRRASSSSCPWRRAARGGA
ncbi:hypothetical protein [Deinococcus pimensis]|uniref:hypothetical protein n=1 Tax=Deinococcus pimensis TaxID=309888 RepID=UPI000488E0C4|nr:hypothetical protein [Deinococcus pimensis]